MSTKLTIFVSSLILIATCVCGFILGKGPSYVEPNETEINMPAKKVSPVSPAIVKETQAAKKDREPAAAANIDLKSDARRVGKEAPIQAGQSHYIVSADAQKIFQDGLSLFSKFEDKEALANWLALGIVFSSEPEFGLELDRIMQKLNEHPERTIAAISEGLKNSGAEAAFMRNMAINLVDHLEVDPAKKVEFYTQEVAKKFEFTDNNSLAESSLPSLQSIGFLRKYIHSEDDMIRAYHEALKGNDDPRAKKEITNSFQANFPEYRGKIL